MGKLALVATIKMVPGRRDEYLKHLSVYSQRYLATELGTLKFETMVRRHSHSARGLCKSGSLRDALAW